MIITFNWLREYIKTKLTTKEIIDNLERLGFNLKEAYINNGLWDQIEIVKIIEKKTHPNADKLNIYKIQKKSKEIIEIVCGDKELNINDHVPYAKPGITMPNGLTLKIALIRDIKSNGMLCSAKEINLPIESTKVLKCFSDDFGKTISQAYDEEGIFEIELTPNRGDALSIRGIARILVNENLGEFIDYIPRINNSNKQNFFEITTNKCKALFCAKINYQPKETPSLIQKRLQLTNHTITKIDVIDYTNYISHAIGQPMHVFDYDKIKNNKLMITELKNEQEYITLANQKVTLNKGSLVFKSGNEIISWPSIIGGENSKVTENTKTILLETGVFEPDPLQRRKLDIHTSASKKTEYGLDPTILEHTANTFLNTINVIPESTQYIPFKEAKKIHFRFNKIKEILGLDINEQEFKETMIKKGFKFNEDKTISPPNYKFFDINTENCIVEEFAISYYDSIKSINLPFKQPKMFTNKNKKVTMLQNFDIKAFIQNTAEYNIVKENLKNLPKETKEKILNQIKTTTLEKININIDDSEQFAEQYMEHLYQNKLQVENKYPKDFYKLDNLTQIALNENFNECKNISLTHKEHEEFKISEKGRTLINSSNKNYSILRGSLIPDLLKNLSWHINNKYKITNFFEQGLIYGENLLNKQQKKFTAISINQKDIRKLLTKILSNYNILYKIQSKESNIPYSNNACDFFINEMHLATIAKLKTTILKEFNIKECYTLELNPNILELLPIPKTSEKLSNQMPIYKDFTITIPENQSSSKLLNFLKSKNYKYEILNIYPENNLNIKRNITIQIMIQSENPLTKEELSKIINKIEKNLNSIY